MKQAILGISAYYHDSAAAILVDGEIVAAAHEERFTRKKHDPSFPHARGALRAGGGRRLEFRDLLAVAFYDKPFLTFERLLETYDAFAPRGLVSFWSAIPVWIKEKLFMKRMLRESLCRTREGDVPIFFPEHHLSHAASAFYPSPFEEAAIVTIDGVGEWATTTIGQGAGKRDHDSPGIKISPFRGAAVFRVHLLHGLPGQQRGIQADGACPLREQRMRPRRRTSSRKSCASWWTSERTGRSSSTWTTSIIATGLRMVNEEKWLDLFGIPAREAGDGDFPGLHEHGAGHPAGDRGDRAPALPHRKGSAPGAKISCWPEASR